MKSFFGRSDGVERSLEATHTKFTQRESHGKDTHSSSGSPVYVNRRDTVSLKRKLSLHACPAHTPISLCFTGFKLVFCILLYNSVSLCLSLPFPPFLPTSSIPILLNSLIPLSQSPVSTHLLPPQAKQCSEYHITQKEQKRNTQTSLNLHLVTQKNKSQWYLS